MVNKIDEKKIEDNEVENEAKRLYNQLSSLGWNYETCLLYAPLTLEINRLKKEKNAIILAHSYQTPDIIFGVADYTGDSYGLSVWASKTNADIIIFSGVKFMAETAKILNPSKRVFIPSLEAGCSLADDITPKDVKELKKNHPGLPVVCYINTSAQVKAECDVCCTSANAEKIISALPDSELIFIPDELMAKNLERITGKKLISWHAKCVVHKDINKEKIKAIKQFFPGIKVLAHSECPLDVTEEADLIGGTSDMERYVKNSSAPFFLLLTECGLSDKLRASLKDKKFVASCSLCPYMKKNSLSSILNILQTLPKENEIILSQEIISKAKKALDKMFELSK
jgi:quinolinate synthase